MGIEVANLHDWTKKQIVVAKALAGALALVGVTYVAGAVPAAASTPQLFVNPIGADTNPCSRALPCATIQHAINVATPGQMIHVSGGMFHEQLTISKSVSIVGASATQTIIQPQSPTTTQTLASDTDPDTSYPDYPIVDIAPGTTGVTIKRMTVDGSQAQTPFDNCSAGNFVGIYFHDASGFVKGVHVTGVEYPPADFGCQTTVAIGVEAASDGASPSNVTLQGLRVSSYGKNGIQCDDVDTDCTVQGSKVTGLGPTTLTGQNGIIVLGGNATITGNHVSGDSYSGGGAGNQASGISVVNAANVNVSGNFVKFCDVDIALLQTPFFGYLPPGGFGTWTITHNTANKAVDNVPGGTPGPAYDGGLGYGFGDGIVIDSGTNSHPINVSNNYVSRNFEFGIALYATSGATVQGNFGQADYDGLYVGGPGFDLYGFNGGLTTSAANNVSNNLFVGEHHDGIWADPDASGNTFANNVLRSSLNKQAEDTSTGASTAGTANSWGPNTCTPMSLASSPAGLC